MIKIFDEGKIVVTYSYYDNGNMKIEQHQNGDYRKIIKYREDGTRLFEKNYFTKEGQKKEGEHKFYDSDGNLTNSAIYKDDKLVKQQ